MPRIPHDQMPIDPYNPPPNYTVYKIQAAGLYMDKATFAVVEGYSVIEMGNFMLEKSDRTQDESLAYAFMAYLRRLVLVNSDMDYREDGIIGEGVFGFTEDKPDA